MEAMAVMMLVLVMVPVSRRPEAHLPVMPAPVPEVGADHPDLLDHRGLDREATIGLLDRAAVTGSRTRQHPIGVAWQRTRRQNRNACGKRQTEFAHILLHPESCPRRGQS